MMTAAFGDHIPQRNAFQESAKRVFDVLSNTFIYRPWIYLLLAMAVVAAGVRRRQPAGLEAALVAASGVAHELPLFFLAPASDYRYSHYMIYASLLSLA